VLPGVTLAAITSAGPAEAWAVGSSANGPFTTVTAEWNGSAWTVVPSPNPSSQDFLDGVSAAPGGGVWAVGNEESSSPSQPMAMHWDGTAWTVVPAHGVAPDTGGYTGTFIGVVAITDSHVIAVGFWNAQAQSLVADLCPFTVGNTGFAPSSATVSGPGAAAYWVIPASDTSGHDLADGTGFGLFDSGVKAPGSTYAFAFPASGTYTVRDSSDGATEQIGVPILVEQNSGGQSGLEWASAPPPSGARFDVQDIAPGGTTFTHYLDTIQTGTAARGLPAGTCKFRSRMRDPATGVTTGWSPTATVTEP
jgi:hypothetical protein